MTIRISLAEIVPARQDELFRWWTDYAPGDHDFIGFDGLAKTSRRVLSREGDRIKLEDTWTLLGKTFLTQEDVSITGNERIDARGTSPWGAYQAAYWFEALPGDSTRVSVLLTGELHGVLSALGPAVNLVGRWSTAWDLRRHVDEFLRDKRGESRGTGQVPKRAITKERPSPAWGTRQYGP